MADPVVFDRARRLAAEGLGTCLLVATVVGSGIMAERLTDDNALALLGNTIPTAAILVVLITTLGPISGAHFNPVVSMIATLRRELGATEASRYILAQVVGGMVGTLIAHAMFAQPLLQVANAARAGAGQWFAEGVATFGLVAVILAGSAMARHAVPWLVGLYIAAAYWFTASTSFANPAVTLARAFTDTFSGIRPIDAPAFIAAQLVGGLVALALIGWLLQPAKEPAS